MYIQRNYGQLQKKFSWEINRKVCSIYTQQKKSGNEDYNYLVELKITWYTEHIKSNNNYKK